MNLTLNDKLSFIGIRVNTNQKLKKSEHIDIEKTIIESVLEFNKDLRLASLIFTWIKVHGNYVITEKLQKLFYKLSSPEMVSIYWFSALAVFAHEHCNYKWKKLITKPKSEVFLFNEEITRSAVKLKGENTLLKKYNFILPENTLRIREMDVLSIKELLKNNLQYKNRYLYGPSWRADIITAIEKGAKNPTEISKLTGCSYEPAHRVFREYSLATG